MVLSIQERCHGNLYSASQDETTQNRTHFLAMCTEGTDLQTFLLYGMSLSAVYDTVVLDRINQRPINAN